MNWAAKMAVGLDTGVPWVMCKEDDAPDPIVSYLFFHSSKSCKDVRFRLLIYNHLNRLIHVMVFTVIHFLPISHTNLSCGLKHGVAGKRFFSESNQLLASFLLSSDFCLDIGLQNLVAQSITVQFRTLLLQLHVSYRGVALLLTITW